MWHGLLMWKAAPGFSMSHFPPCHHGKSPTTSSEGQNKSQCSEFLKLRLLEPCSLPEAPVAAKPSGSYAPRQEKAQMNGASVLLDGQEKERERDSLFPWDILAWVWGGQVLFQNHQ